MNDIVPLLKHTPSAQDPAVLEAITVQHEPVIADLVDSALDIRGGVRHQLLVGPRGIGKTHILSLVASRVRAASEHEDIVIAWLDEDPWAVRTYGKFLAAILARVAAETRDRELASSATDLRSSGDITSGMKGEELLREAVGDRRLVLLVENLDEIFRRIGLDGQAKFRAFAEDWRQLLILATTPQLFAGVRRHTSPFYGFFAVTHIDELSLENAGELLRRIAELRGDSTLREFLGSDVAARRLEAIEALAGGHPRVWLLLAGCISIAAIDELVPLFLEALDELTPYYQDRLRELGDQQQEIVVLLSEAGGALSNRALAERSGIAQNQIATMLRQLTDRGYVRRAELPPGLGAGDKRMSYWELREPLMRLCLDVKQSRGEPLRIVVEFLRAWYGPRLLDELGRLPPSAELAASYATEAFRSLEMSLQTSDLLRGTPREILTRAELGLSLLPTSSSLQSAKATALVMDGKYVEARGLIEQLLAAEPSGPGYLVWRLQLQLVKLSLGEPVDVDGLISEALELHQGGAGNAYTAGLVAFAYGLAGRDEDALVAWQQAIAYEPTGAHIHMEHGRLLIHMGRYEEALDAVGRAVELAPHDAAYHDARGEILEHLGRDGDALDAFTRAVELDPDVGAYHDHQGVMLGRLGRRDEALQALERAIALVPSDAGFQTRYGAVLALLDRFEEALEVFTRVVELDASASAHHATRAGVLRRLGRYEDALDGFTRAAELAPDEMAYHKQRGGVLLRLGRIAEALDAYTRAVELAPGSAACHGLRGTALARLGREEEALEAFTRAAALDPDNSLHHEIRGILLGRVNRLEEALEAFARAVELTPEKETVHDFRARVLVRLGRPEEALEAVTHAVERNPAASQRHNFRAHILRGLGKVDEAEKAVRRAIELDDQNSVFRFTLAEVVLTGGDAERAVLLLRDALATWSGERTTTAGEPDLLCRIVWERFQGDARRAQLIEQIVSAFREVDAIEELGAGVVKSASLLVEDRVSQQAADAWAEDWATASREGELEIALGMLRAACAWKRDGDRSHLLALPPEQREILVRLLRP